MAGKRGKRKRPPVQEDDEDDNVLMEENGDGEGAMVEGREGYVNGLLKQLIKVLRNCIICRMYQFVSGSPGNSMV